jgi:spermidine/putrescine ABC transporter ATP-binding subunit
MQPALVLIKQVTKRFGDALAVDNVSLEVQPGEFFSLLGPSGCGKSTLLRMLAGFESPTEGEICIGGREMATIPPYARPTNMVFQSYALFPHLDVRSNIGYGLRSLRLSRKERMERITNALALIRLEEYGSRRPDQLSGGQRQRVALARALVRRPQVLLLDEPLGALDKKLRADMQVELRELQRKLGITFIFVTHDQEEALTLSDRIGVMTRGRILQVGTCRQIYEMPCTREVAESFGNMNIFDGEATGRWESGIVIKSAALGTIRVQASPDFPAETGNVAFGIRAEKIVLSASRPPDAQNAISGTVVSTSYLGDRTFANVTIAGRLQLVCVVYSDLGLTENSTVAVGSEVWMQWPPSAAVLLSP